MTQSKKAKKTALVLLVFLILAAFVRFYVLPKHFFPKKYSDIVEKYAAEYGLDENLVYAMIKAESNFNPNAVSNKDARGLMQISESTGLWGAEELNIPDYTNDSLFDPEINIKIGCWYFDKLLNQYGNTDAAIAAYNAGSGNVSKWLEKENYSLDGKTLDYIPYKETRDHIKKTNLFCKIYDFLY